MVSLAELLLAWYDGAKRDLPWRRDSDPYKIWVSEIMLQQTRVEAVKPYFERWLERFPTLGELAAADDDEVLRHWQGLGYYSRARHLLAGVREVAASYGGRIPDTREEIRTVPGIGEYTAGAILSMAYGQAEPAVDGNVLRVFSRLFCLEADVATAPAKRRVVELVTEAMPGGRCGDFNQALMDLGATICLPKSPRCSVCPLTTLCCAFDRGDQSLFPVKRKKAPPLPVRVAAAVVERGGSYLVRRRPDKGLLAGMWEFPAVEAGEAGDLRIVLQTAVGAETGQSILTGEILLELTHTFSHRQWLITFYRCHLEGESSLSGGGLRWVGIEEWQGLTWAGPHGKMAAFLAGGGA
ncbi:MAG: A/G-specific adenine glycosylase [Negativicutes bacterium]|nr:A/G-specific adenine glycosylase [Negativicutes bacterium]MDR3589895.1 A/G-specific adenine glycosylase [Negativicutes bacterium]